ncbi:MarR family transcriptional regulator [Myxococcota bacterium]|nr:MarR family transcriptional regulator [Myxococcota bacterium]
MGSNAGSAAVSPLDAHLGYWLRFVSNHVSRGFEAKVERRGVTVAEWVVMRALFDAETFQPSELSAQLGLTRGAVSKLLQRLAAKDLVVIRADARDGRAQLVALTAAGRRLVPVLAALADENDAEAFGHLTVKERAALRATLEGIVEHLGLDHTPVD